MYLSLYTVRSFLRKQQVTRVVQCTARGRESDLGTCHAYTYAMYIMFMCAIFAFESDVSRRLQSLIYPQTCQRQPRQSAYWWGGWYESLHAFTKIKTGLNLPYSVWIIQSKQDKTASVNTKKKWRVMLAVTDWHRLGAGPWHRRLTV